MPRTPDQLHYRAQINERIGQQLREFYQSCMTEELPTRLVAALKKLDEEFPQAHGQAKSDIPNKKAIG
jgi:hypothetical protein